MSPLPHRVVLLSRVGCHLCEVARNVVAQVVERVGPEAAGWTETDVDSDPELRGEYGDLVPVVLIDDVCHGYYEINPGRLEKSLLA